MEKKKSILVEISVDTIKETLQKEIKSEHAPIIANAIIEQLSRTEVGMEDLYFALQGVVREFKYKILDEVWVRFDQLPSWRMDKVAMKTEGLIVRDTYVKCTVTDINPFSRTCYSIEYKCIKNTETDVSTDTFVAAEVGIAGLYSEEENLFPV